MAGPGKIKTRNRSKARVQITYTNPTDADKLVELPFVMGVMADLSGNRSKVSKPIVSERDFTPVDIDNFDKYMAKVQPGIGVEVDNKLGDKGGKLKFDLHFKSMADFEPAAVVKQIPPLAKLLEMRERLHNLRAYMDGKGTSEELLQQLLSNPDLMRAISEQKSAKEPDEDKGA